MKNPKTICLAFIIFCGAFFALTLQAEETEEVQTEVGLEQIKVAGSGLSSSKEAGRVELKEEQLAAINQSLKNALEENRKLQDEKTAGEQELKSLRGESDINSNRINFLNRQRDDILKRAEDAEKAVKDNKQQLQELQKTFNETQTELTAKIKAIEETQARKEAEQKQAMENVLPSKIKDASSSKDRELLKVKTEKNLNALEKSIKKTNTQVASLRADNARLSRESAKLHYNLANMFYDRGQYQKAVDEYQRVLELTPSDAAAHYNLAFINGEYLDNMPEALKDYKEYLHLNPGAEDAGPVKEKILDIQLKLRQPMSSWLDNAVEKEKPELKVRD